MIINNKNKMKRFFKFLKFCIGFGKPSTKQIEELVSREVQELDTLKKSVEEMRIIHKNVSEKISQNRAEEIEVIHEDVNYKNIVKPKEKRLSKDEIIKLFLDGKQLSIFGLIRKEKQYYAKKIYVLKTKRNMKIKFSKKTKSYKYYPNGL